MFQDLFDLLFPKICAGCNHSLLKNERTICTACRNELPVTNSHLENGNEVEKVFYGRVAIEHAIALLVFEKKGITQQLMHALKYKGNTAVGTELGAWVLQNLRRTSWHRQIELIVPVPLHKTRLRKRGYNQVEGFGKVLAEGLGVEYNDRCLVKIHASKTQVFKNLTARFRNAEHSFEIDHQQAADLRNKHILLVDDIITTGATLETCAEKLLEIPNTKVSVATLAKTPRIFV